MNTTPFYKQGSFYFSLAALGVAVVALARTDAATQLAYQQEFRSAIIGLQESMTPPSSTSASLRDRPSQVKGWIFYDAARRLESKLDGKIPAVDYLILAHFAYSHTDLEGAQKYLDQAIKQVERDPHSTECCLLRMGAAHLQFTHYPKTKLDDGRKYYDAAIENAGKLSGDEATFVRLNVLREAAIDEYATGHLAEGDARIAEAHKLLDESKLPEKFVAEYKANLDEGVIEAKVRGKLL